MNDLHDERAYQGIHPFRDKGPAHRIHAGRQEAF